jgi:hypothetical protein
MIVANGVITILLPDWPKNAAAALNGAAAVAFSMGLADGPRAAMMHVN